MKRLLLTALATAAALLTAFLLGRASATPAGPKFGVSMTTAGFLTVVSITDNPAQKLYVYSVERNELSLRSTVDLTRAGAPTIPLTPPPTPASTQPNQP